MAKHRGSAISGGSRSGVKKKGASDGASSCTDDAGIGRGTRKHAFERLAQRQRRRLAGWRHRRLQLARPKDSSSRHDWSVAVHGNHGAGLLRRTSKDPIAEISERGSCLREVRFCADGVGFARQLGFMMSLDRGERPCDACAFGEGSRVGAGHAFATSHVTLGICPEPAKIHNMSASILGQQMVA
jgi:hypothetical protein